MRTSVMLFLACLLGPLSGLVAEASSFKTYSQGLGINLGVASGAGVSYRDLDTQSGWQWTGIVFKDPSESSATPVLFSAGFGLIKPIGVYSIPGWLDVMLYLQGSLATNGSWGLEKTPKSLSGMVGLSGSYGFEFLLWDHLSFNFEVAQTGGAELPSDRKQPWGYQYFAVVYPQFALYFRY